MYLSDNARKHLDSISDSNKIVRLVDDVENWDLYALIDWVQDEMESKLESATREKLNFAYMLAFEQEVEDAIYEEPTDIEPETCVCPISIGGIIHEVNCPERKQ